MSDEDEEVVLHVIHCVPADPVLLARFNAQQPPDRQWSPSILHSLTQCDRCGRACWIGPRQKTLMQSGVHKMCSICIVQEADTLGVRHLRAQSQRR